MDNLKGILIVLVVLSHFLQLYVFEGTASIPVQAIYYFIFSFHMPLFVFISGYFSKNLEKARNTAFTRLFIPYLFFNTTMVLFLYSTRQSGISLFTPQYVYWYILALFVWRFALKDIARIRFILPLSIVASIFSGCFSEVNNFLAISRIINFFPFFLLGYYADQACISRLRATNRLLALTAFGLCALCVYWLTYNGFLSIEIFTTSTYNSVGDCYLRLVFYFFAMVIGACVIILCPSRRLAIFTMAGGSTFLIYVLHRYVSFVVHWLVPVEQWNDLYTIPLLILSLITVVLLGQHSLLRAYVRLLNRVINTVQVSPTENRMSVRTRRILIVVLIIVNVPLCFYAFSDARVKSAGEPRDNSVIHRVMDSDTQGKFASSITISFVGDLILLEDQVKSAWNPKTNSYDFSPVFCHAKKYLEKADYSIGILELPVAGKDSGYSQGNFDDGVPIYLNAPKQWPKDIKNSGIDLVTTANNHALDKGVEGLIRTLDVLDELGLNHVGTYRNLEERGKVFVTDIRDVKVAFIAYTYGVNYTNNSYFDESNQHLIGILSSPRYKKGFSKSREMLIQDIKRANRHNPDLIIALPHMGTQFSHAPDKFSKTWADIMFQEGVDVVFAAGSHAVQPMEIRTICTKDGNKKNGFVLYSPGNFVNSYTEHNGDAAAIVSIHLESSGRTKGRLIGASVVPMWIHSSMDGQYGPIPIYEAITNKKIRSELSRFELDRIRDVQGLITETMLKSNISMDQVQDYYYISEHGYMRQPLALELTEEIDSVLLDKNRKRLREILSTAEKTIVLGDSISEGTRNGGYPWYEPLTHIFSGNNFVNKSFGGETSATMLSRLDDILRETADVFIVAVGTNDIRYRNKNICAMTADAFIANADTIAKKILAKNPAAHIVFINVWLAYNNDIYSVPDNTQRDQMIEKYNEVLELYCFENNHIFIGANVYIRHFLETRITRDYIIDHIHPNAGKGVRIYSNAVLFGEYDKWAIKF
ncbi:MAG: CapA family protein [Planctomycetota bacterium]|jgi:fucose 4-O-acetylase-like acetyltransferase/poly-gamma-glutamate capsule biosynthesis protein CapA/YwtB (metallophosphatase superfamily)/lysophospholipase L1-like esterase